MRPEKYTFIIAANNRKVLEENALHSDILLNNSHEIIIQEGYDSASKAYNDALKKSSNDILVFIHQDIFLPANWDIRLDGIINELTNNKVNWGVLGCFGISIENETVGNVYCNGNQKHLMGNNKYGVVQTLDEIVLILNKKNNIYFDEQLNFFHFYGTDICFTAYSKGYQNFAIDNFCIHNSLPVLRFDWKFKKCAYYIQNKWKRFLPIKTPCINIHSTKVNLYKELLIRDYRYYKNNFSKKRVPIKRLDKQKLKQLVEKSINETNQFVKDSDFA